MHILTNNTQNIFILWDGGGTGRNILLKMFYFHL